jgi:hypothetical protein
MWTSAHTVESRMGTWRHSGQLPSPSMKLCRAVQICSRRRSPLLKMLMPTGASTLADALNSM